MRSCIFISVPRECIWKVNDECTAVDATVVQCLINHRRLILTHEGSAAALKAFVDAHLNDTDRVKPIAGQAGRDALE